MKCSWAPGWCWSQAKGNTERERGGSRRQRCEDGGWRAAGDSLCESSLLVPVSLLLVSRALPHREAQAKLQTHKIKQSTGTTEISFILSYFIFKALLQGHQLILHLIEAETKISAQCRFCFIWFILNIHPGVFTRALCVFMKIFFSLGFCFFLCVGKGIVLWDLYQYFII